MLHMGVCTRGKKRNITSISGTACVSSSPEVRSAAFHACCGARCWKPTIVIVMSQTTVSM